MKTIRIYIVLAAVMLSGCNQNHESAESTSKEVICIHNIQIKPGISEKEFESFVMTEIAPIYNQMKGQHFVLARGDRGIRNGKYAFIISFESIEDRDRIYPPDIGFSDEFKKIMEEKDEMWAKFNTMAEGFDGNHHTDYVVIDN